MWIAKKRFNKLKNNKYATKVQCMYRLYKARKIVSELLKERERKRKEDAANLIRAAYINWRVRKYTTT